MSQKIESETLKKQFESLQEQQQKKLLKRKQKQEELKKQKTASAASLKTSVARSSTFGIADDLDLKLADPPPPSNAIYSEELVNHLNDQIRELKDETGRLYKLLSERDLELRQLRKKREEDKLLQGGNVAGDAASTKIVDLSKKIRQMSTEMEAEKTRSKQLQRRVMELEQQAQNTGDTGGKKSTPASARGDAEKEKDPEQVIKALQDKLRHAEMKVSEFRNQGSTLKNELKMAQKAIEQEVGEGATIQSVSNTTSNWRGRAQQIINLQKKVNELRSQLDQYKPSTTSGGDVDDLEAEFMGSATSSRKGRDDRQKNEIRKMEKERKEHQERLVGELKALEVDHEALKGKFDSSKARNKILSTEVKTLKHQVQMLLDKGKHDDELVEALFKQISQLKQALDETDKSKRQRDSDHDETVKQLAQRTQHENNIVDQLKAIVAEREAKVHALEEEIQQLRLTNLQKAQLNGVSEMFDGQSSSVPVSARTMVLEDCGSMTPLPQSRAESRQVHSRVDHDSPLSHAQHSRPNSSRASSRRPDSGKERQLEELRVQVQEYKSMCQAATVERDKLAELVTVLQARIDETTAHATDSQADVAAVKRKCVQLEKQLGKAKMEQSTSASINKRMMGSKVSLSANFEDALTAEDQLEEMETKLLIQTDENEALKAALQSTLKAKEEDLKLYHQMIDETKSIFLQGLRQYRDNVK